MREEAGQKICAIGSVNFIRKIVYNLPNNIVEKEIVKDVLLNLKTSFVITGNFSAHHKQWVYSSKIHSV